MSYQQTLNDDIYLINTGLLGEEVVACYLLKSAGEAAIIETGNYLTAQRILEVMTAENVAPEDVKYVIATHVHLDHAGGASELLKQLPNAILLVHPSGYKHMHDPTKLIAASTAVYGEERFRAMYGDIEAIAAERIEAVEDLSSYIFGERELFFEHTPGHAYHHFCIWDSLSQGWFTGDTFGLCYKQVKHLPKPLLIPTTTPSQFDPEALKNSIDKLLAKSPRYMYLTHYGRFDVTSESGDWLKAQIDAYVEITKQHGAELTKPEQLAEILFDYTFNLQKPFNPELSEEAVRQVLKMDLLLNSQGLLYWYQKHHS